MADCEFRSAIIVKFVTHLNIYQMLKTRNISFTYSEYEKPEEIDAGDQELISAAKTAAGNAYAPYSKFRVGAAVRLGSGMIISGSNVENAAFPSGICAERTALSSAVSLYPCDHPVAIAIAAMNDNGITADNISPCGNCRQVMAEEEMRSGKPIRIIMAGSYNIRVVDSVSHLLPLQFSKKNLTAGHP